MSLKYPALVLMASFALLSGCSAGVKQENQVSDITFTMHRYPANAGKDACVHVTKRLMGLAEYHPVHGVASVLTPEFAYIFKRDVPCEVDSLPLDATLVPYSLQVL